MKKFTKKGTPIFAILFAVIMVFTLSGTSLVFAEDSDVNVLASPAESLASSINSGVAKNIITAVASGSTVTVSTKSSSTSAPHLELNIPTGVTVVWKANYVNTSFLPVPTGDEDSYTKSDYALISISGGGLFSIQTGAVIKVTESSASLANDISAIASDGVSIEMSGGEVVSTTVIDSSSCTAIDFSGSTLIKFTLSDGVISSNAIISDSKHPKEIGGVVLSGIDDVIVNITGGRINASSIGAETYAFACADAKITSKVNMSGGILNAVSKTGASIALAGLNVEVNGGLLFSESPTAYGIFSQDGYLKIGDDVGIFTFGETVGPYFYDGPTTYISDKFANTQITKLSLPTGTVKEGEKIQLTPTISPTDTTAKRTYKHFTWTSSDKSIATVDSDGKVTGVKVGVATITATAVDLSGVTANAKITVKKGTETSDEPDLDDSQEPSDVPDSDDSKVYTVLENFGTYNGIGTISARIDADYRNFVKLTYKDVDVDSEHYTVTEGSTIITFNENYVKTFAPGTYIFVAEFSDGTSEGITLVVSDQPGSSATSDQPGSPRTFDSTSFVWVITICALALVSLFALITANRRRQGTKKI
jgi:hypothetical protein